MSRPTTIDASVFVRASSPAEGRFEESREFLLRLAASTVQIVLPTLMKPEVASAVRRATGQPALAARIAADIDAIGGVIWVSLDQPLALEAAELSILTGLRGADPVYVATALRFDAILVTLDEEQKRRLPAVTTARYPSEALES